MGLAGEGEVKIFIYLVQQITAMTFEKQTHMLISRLIEYFVQSKDKFQ